MTIQTAPSFESIVDKIQDYMDSMVDEGSDQDLFIAGYLSGHFSLVVSQCQLNGNQTREELNKVMGESLQSAFSNGELEETDQKDALEFWQRCLDL